MTLLPIFNFQRRLRTCSPYYNAKFIEIDWRNVSIGGFVNDITYLFTTLTISLSPQVWSIKIFLSPYSTTRRFRSFINSHLLTTVNKSLFYSTNSMFTWNSYSWNGSYWLSNTWQHFFSYRTKLYKLFNLLDT